MDQKKVDLWSERVAAGLLLACLWIASTIRWLIGSALGALVLALAAYLYLRKRSLSRPLVPHELLDWFIGQGHDVKLGLVGALLTLIGFAIAFWTASATWKRQKELELRLDAARAVHVRFQRAIRHLNHAAAYLHLLTDALRAIAVQGVTPQTAQSLAFVDSKGTEFSNHRQQLYAAMLDVYELYGEYANVCGNVPNAMADIKKSAGAIEAAQRALAPIIPPHADTSKQNFAATFLTQCNLPMLEAAQTEAERQRHNASVLYGRAAGVLIAAIVRPNFFGLLNVTRLGRTAGAVILTGRKKRRIR
jgi:hypothetical protein